MNTLEEATDRGYIWSGALQVRAPRAPRSQIKLPCLVEGSPELSTELPNEFRIFFKVVVEAIQRMRSWGKSLHAVIVGDGVLKFELETAV